MSVKLPISFKLVAVLLSVPVLLVSLPLSAMASGNPESSAVSEEPDSLHASEAESADGTARVLYELTQFRDADTKRFRQSDGTVRVVQYGEPVHYLDASGAWQDMDNTLISSEDVFSTADSRVRFAKTVTESSPLLSFNSGRHAVRVFLTGSLSRSVGTVSASGRSGSPDDTDTIDIEKIPARIPSEIRYESITGHTDLSYTVTGSSVKETIVVKAPCDSYSYSFLLDLDHLEAKALDDGTIRLSDPDTEETVFVIPAGFMTDAAGEESAQVSYTLTKTDDGRYMLTVEAYAGWIRDPSRSFPISIDPSFYATYGSMQDLYVSEVFPNTSYSSTTSLIVNESTGHSRIGYWKTDDLPPLPASACITEATLSLYSSSVGGSYVGAYAAVSSWNNTLTWNKTVSSVPEGVLSANLLDYACVDGSPSDSRYTFDLTSLVRSWYDETVANYGIGLKTVPGTASSGSVSFRSSDYSASSARPLFTVVYKDMKGVEPYWSVSAQDLGLAGTGYVNLATGSLTVVKPLLSTTDYLFPYTPTITYHSSMAGKAWVYPNAENSFSTSYMPYGFRLNITETVIRKQYGLPDGTSADYYIWSDADGTEHAFYGIGGSDTEFQDEDGLQLRLTIGTGQCTLTDDSKTVKTFSRMTDTPDTQVLDAYYLSSVRDRNQNTVSFAFSSNYKPMSVTMKPNGLGNPIYFLTFAYTSYGLPYLIWNQSTKEAIVFRYSSTPTGSISAADPHYLRELVHAHGSAGLTASDWDSFYADETYTTHITVDGKASYSYDSNGFLISCKDHLSDSEIRYTVSGGKIGTAQEYSGSYAGQKIGFTYWSGYTDVRTGGTDDAYYTSDDLITRYTFDKEGRTAGVWSTDTGGSQVYGASASEYETADRVRNNLKSRTVVGGSPANYLLNGGFERVNSDSDALYWNETANVRFNSTPAEEDGGNRRAYFPGQNGVTDSITQYVRLPEGTYTLSMSVHTYHCENMDVQVRARSLSDPLRDFAEDVPVNDFYASGGAQPFSMTFTAEDDNSGFEYFEISILVTGGYIGTSGEVSVGIDNVMLEESIGSSRYSMVEMGNFEMSSLNASGTAYAEHGTDFWLDQSNTLVRASASAPFGYAGQVTGSIAEERYLKQRVYTAPAYVLSDYDELYATTPVTTYLISGFAKGTGQVHSPHGIFALRVDITYYNGSGNADTVVSSLFRFQNDCSDWQFVTGSVRTEEYRCVKALDVLCVFAYQPGGCALFDDIAFSVNDDDSVVRYGYYDSGDQNGLLHVKETGWYTEVYEYNSDRQLVRVANNRGELHDYAYAANGADVSSDTYFTFTPKTYPYLSSDPDSHITKTPKLRTIHAVGAAVLERTADGHVLLRSGIRRIRERRRQDGDRIRDVLEPVRDDGRLQNLRRADGGNGHPGKTDPLLLRQRERISPGRRQYRQRDRDLLLLRRDRESGGRLPVFVRHFVQPGLRMRKRVLFLRQSQPAGEHRNGFDAIPVHL